MMLCEKHVADIRKLLRNNVTLETIAARMGCRPSEVTRAVNQFDAENGREFVIVCEEHLADLRIKDGERQSWPTWSGPYRRAGDNGRA